MRIEWATPCAGVQKHPDDRMDILTANAVGTSVARLGDRGTLSIAVSYRLERGEDFTVGRTAVEVRDPDGEIVGTGQTSGTFDHGEVTSDEPVRRGIVPMTVTFLTTTEGRYTLVLSLGAEAEFELAFSVSAAGTDGR